MTLRRGIPVSPLCFFLLLAIAAAPVYGDDGVIEINQAKALAGGVSPDDTEGFPVTIGASGSYRLTGNLTVPDENTTAIDVVFGFGARQVTIDLNGFSIIGPTVCAGVPPNIECTPVGSGRGIESTAVQLEVKNGFVTGMGNEGIRIQSSAIVDNVTVTSCGGSGFFVIGTVRNSRAEQNGGHGFEGGGLLSSGNALINGGNGVHWGGGQIVDSVLQSNGGDGIFLDSGVVANNHVTRNGGDGISVASSSTSLTGNTVTGNDGIGLRMTSATVGYRDNHVTSNSGGTVTGGTESGTNFCATDTTCP